MRRSEVERQLLREQQLQLKVSNSQLREGKEGTQLESLELRAWLQNAKGEARLKTKHTEELISQFTSQVALKKDTLKILTLMI